MTYSQKLRALFPEISLTWEDLLMLEAFQIKYLPGRVATKEFAVLIHEYPVLHNFLVTKYPPITSFLSDIMKDFKALNDQKQVKEMCQEALWEIADLIIYNKYPDIFDTKAAITWELEDISSLVPLKGKVVADVGAGSGRIAFLVAPHVETVFAIEPINSFRSFMKKKANNQKADNIYVLDGTLDSVPLPDDSLDILLTSNAIGWDLQEELNEIERVVKHGGHVMHLLQSDKEQDNPLHNILTSAPWNYICRKVEEESKLKLSYHKRIREH